MANDMVIQPNNIRLKKDKKKLPGIKLKTFPGGSSKELVQPPKIK